MPFLGVLKAENAGRKKLRCHVGGSLEKRPPDPCNTEKPFLDNSDYVYSFEMRGDGVKMGKMGNPFSFLAE